MVNKETMFVLWFKLIDDWCDSLLGYSGIFEIITDKGLRA